MIESGAADEFTTIYRRHAPDVLRFAFYLCGDRKEAEDIASEAFVRAWTSPTPIVVDTVKAYLFTIVRNLYLQNKRRSARHAPMHDQVADARPSAERVTEQRDEIAAAAERVARLPEIDRGAFLMRVDGSTYEDIGAALGISAGAARVKVHRARLALAGIR
jgi:RNA polymerase sigma-70 factor (ECF subfamily)